MVGAHAQNGVAVGNNAQATQRRAVAIGLDALGSRPDTVAVGAGARAGHDRATAIGNGAATTRNGQVMLGGTGTSVALGDIAASDAAQIGPEKFVTIDASGTLGVSNAASAGAVAQVQATMSQVVEVSNARFGALDDRVHLLERAMQDFDLRMEGLEGGIAAAMALGAAAPILGRRFTVTLAGASYGGAQAFAGLVTGRLGEAVYLSAGISGNTADDRLGARVAASFGF